MLRWRQTYMGLLRIGITTGTVTANTIAQIGATHTPAGVIGVAAEWLHGCSPVLSSQQSEPFLREPGWLSSEGYQPGSLILALPRSGRR